MVHNTHLYVRRGELTQSEGDQYSAGGTATSHTVKHFKWITEQIRVNSETNKQKKTQSGWKSTEFIIPDVKTMKALSPSNLLTQIHQANKSLFTCITLQLQTVISISMCLIQLGSFVDLRRIVLDKDKQAKMWKRTDKSKHYEMFCCQK